MLRSIRFLLTIVLLLLFVLSQQGFSQHTSYSDADSQIAVAVNDTIVLRLGDYVGEFVQWQKSSDMVIWLDVPEANADTLTFSSENSTTIYFRAKVVAGCCDPFISSSILVEVFNHSQLNTTAVSGITAISANSGGTIFDDGGTPISARGVIWGTWANPSIDNNLGITNDGSGTGTFVSELTDLTPNTNYYVRAYATTMIGTSYGQQLSFTTLNGEVLLTTAPISNITSFSAVSGGNITSDGGAAVTARGLVWSISTNPTISSNNGITVNGSGTGSWVSEMFDLNPNTTYYVRSYATNFIGTFYGDEKTFTTLAAFPQVTTTEVSNITATTAVSGGEVTDDGGATVTARGVVWSTSDNPTLDNNDGFTQNGSGTGTWVSNLTNLSPNTTYYVRAYATNSVGTQYGNQRSFTTLKALPQVTTTEVTGITATTAVSGGEVTHDGGTTVTARGVCWSTGQNPTIVDSHTTDGAGTGTFTSNITELLPNTTYYVRAYATNSIGTQYGNQQSFTTLKALPQVTTSEVSGITATTAVSGGEVTDDGGATVTARGVVWSSSENPTLDNNDGFTQNGSGTGTWVSNLTNLSPNTTYYVRAYATNSTGTQYGNQRSFTTLKSLPQVTTTEVSGITATTAVSGGEVIHDGGEPVTARGVCWSTSQNPTIVDSHTTDEAGTGTFTSTITDLLPNTTYYVRAYATNIVGTAYGEQKTFTTATTPTVLTADITNILTTTATGGGNVTASGGVAVTAKGVVWNTSQNPTTTNNLGITNDGSGTGSFVSEINELTAGTTYYVRAYATNEAGTAYGEQKSFTTILMPSVTTTPISWITNSSAISGGNITSDGGAPVTARGVCFSTSENPTTEDYYTEDGTGMGEYTSNLVGLDFSTTYYVRAYVTTNAGTTYGEEFTFTTPHKSYIRMADFPGPPREDAVSFSVNGKAYYGLGCNFQTSTSYADFWVYDPIENNWTQLNNFPGGERVSAVGFTIGDYGYVGTGSVLNDFWQYNPTTDQWVQKADFGGGGVGGRQYSVGFAINGKGYIGLGDDGMYFKRDFWEYDPASNSWTQIADFPNARYAATAFVVNQKAYVSCGWFYQYPQGGTHYNDMYEYDPITNQWSLKASLPSYGRLRHIGFSWSGYGYIGTGMDNGNRFNDLWQYNPDADSWVKKSDIPLTYRYSAISFIINDKIYIGLGAKNENSEYLGDFWEYDPELD